jgi:hypothetical protein
MRDVTASKIGIQVVTAGNAGAKCHLGIYENAGNTNNAPSGLVIDAGELDISSTGFKSLNIDQALTADTRYWAALLSNDGVAVVLTVAAGTSAKSIHWGAAEPFGVIQPVSAVNSSQNYGALPNTFPTAGLFLGGVNPMVALGFSAVI